MKTNLTKHLKSLMLGGAMALASGHSVEAAASGSESSSGNSPIDTRASKVRSALESQSEASVLPGEGNNAMQAGTMWWRNGGWTRGWGNGGWGNGGWRNGGWGNGGWRRGWGNGGLGIHVNL